MARSFTPAASVSSAAQGAPGTRAGLALHTAGRRGPSCVSPGTPARRSPARRPPCCGRSHASGRSPEPARPQLSAHSFAPAQVAPHQDAFWATSASVGLTSGVFLPRHQYAPRWRPMAAASGSRACPLGPHPGACLRYRWERRVCRGGAGAELGAEAGGERPVCGQGRWRSGVGGGVGGRPGPAWDGAVPTRPRSHFRAAQKSAAGSRPCSITPALLT